MSMADLDGRPAGAARVVRVIVADLLTDGYLGSRSSSVSCPSK